MERSFACRLRNVAGQLQHAHQPYKGNVWQQTVSALPSTDHLSYELLDPSRMQTYGFEYRPSVSNSLLHD